MTLQAWTSFVLFTLTWSLIPGPSVGFTVAYAIRHGLPPAVSSIAGQLVANAVQMLLLSVGLSRLLEGSLELFAVLKLVGAGYLVYLGLRQWLARDAEHVTVDQDRGRADAAWRGFRRGFLVCAMNPKALLYFAALLPQFVAPESGRCAQFAVLGATNLLIGGFVLILYALFAQSMRGWLSSRRRANVRNRVAGGLMIAAGAYLAIGRRS